MRERLSLPEKIQRSVYQYAPGPPSDHAYDDLSAMLRQVLSTDKARAKELEGEEDEIFEDEEQ